MIRIRFLLPILVLGVLATALNFAHAASPTLDLDKVRRLAQAGDAHAQYDLGMALCCARGMPKDMAEAARWFARAAEQGLADAQSTLGWMYMTGQGVERDDAEALRFLRQAAAQGNTSAENNLGIMHAEGRGVPVDGDEAEKWFRRAAAKGAPDARRNLEALLKRRAAPSEPSPSRPRT